MTAIFQQRLNVELLRSEKRRTIILLCIFAFGIIYQATDMAFFKQGDEEMIRLRSFQIAWLFPLAIIVFEFLSLLYINARLKKNNRQIPLAGQYFNAAIEICLLSFIIFSVIKKHAYINVLQSPAVFVYFVFIILSTLRLNFGLSFFCGSLASLSYISFSYITYADFSSIEIIKAIIILFCGIAAGLVARQIRRGIDRSALESERRHKAESLFGQQISMEIAEKMLEKDGKIESKRMHVAIMFIDIRNFTQFVSDKSPEEIVQYQNAFFAIVIDAIAKHGGIINQFLGDGCMVTFGAPLPIPNPAQKAVDASLEILKQLDSSIEDGKLASTRIGIGIHAGEAVTGNIGTNRRQQYSVTGNVVIMAARIEQLNKKFDSQVVVSEEVVKSIGHSLIPVVPLGAIPLKGLQHEFQVYKLA